MPGAGASTAAEDMLTMEPPRCATITLPAAWHPYTTPLRFTDRMRSNSSGSRSMMVLSIMIPAMLHMTCSPPWRAATVSTRCAAAPELRDVELRALRPAALAEDGARRLGRPRPRRCPRRPRWRRLRPAPRPWCARCCRRPRSRGPPGPSGRTRLAHSGRFPPAHLTCPVAPPSGRVRPGLYPVDGVVGGDVLERVERRTCGRPGCGAGPRGPA